MPDIGKLLWPKTVAVVGASSDTNGLRGRILEVMLSHPFAGQGLSGEPQRRRSARPQGLSFGRSSAGTGRSRDPHHSRAIRAGRTGTLRPRRHQGRGHSLLRLCRGAGRSGPPHAGRDHRHRAALRHGGERTQHRGLCQYRSRALPDLQPGHGQERRRHPPGARARQRPGVGDLAKRRARLCLLRPRARRAIWRSATSSPPATRPRSKSPTSSITCSTKARPTSSCCCSRT